MFGTYETIDARPTLGFERRIAHPIETVWRAITEPEQLAQWFPCTVALELRLGGTMSFTFPPGTAAEEAVTMLGSVTELDPPRRFAFLWGEDHLHFALEPVDGDAACLLHFSVELDAREKAARDGTGWHQCLDGLETLLAGDGSSRPSDPAAWRGLYAEYERRGFPTGAAIPD
jgi:uncharacterized protein YndB with AHSA1/START domain